jgi:hypothetical protein
MTVLTFYQFCQKKYTKCNHFNAARIATAQERSSRQDEVSSEQRPFGWGRNEIQITNCAQKAAGKACSCHIDDGVSQHPSRVSHSVHPCMIEHSYAFEPLFGGVPLKFLEGT